MIICRSCRSGNNATTGGPRRASLHYGVNDFGIEDSLHVGRNAWDPVRDIFSPFIDLPKTKLAAIGTQLCPSPQSKGCTWTTASHQSPKRLPQRSVKENSWRWENYSPNSGLPGRMARRRKGDKAGKLRTPSHGFNVLERTSRSTPYRQLP